MVSTDIFGLALLKHESSIQSRRSPGYEIRLRDRIKTERLQERSPYKHYEEQYPANNLEY